MAGLAMLALLLAAMLVLMVQATTGASRAATAADLAALAAADAARGITVGEPCTEAAAIAEQHGAELVRCDVGGTGAGTVVIRVIVGTAGPLPDATGSARAGPPE
jgi:secretion/DNA translocation related TadE-like protein